MLKEVSREADEYLANIVEEHGFCPDPTQAAFVTGHGKIERIRLAGDDLGRLTPYGEAPVTELLGLCWDPFDPHDVINRNEIRRFVHRNATGECVLVSLRLKESPYLRLYTSSKPHVPIGPYIPLLGEVGEKTMLHLRPESAAGAVEWTRGNEAHPFGPQPEFPNRRDRPDIRDPLTEFKHAAVVSPHTDLSPLANAREVHICGQSGNQGRVEMLAMAQRLRDCLPHLKIYYAFYVADRPDGWDFGEDVTGVEHVMPHFARFFRLLKPKRVPDKSTGRLKGWSYVIDPDFLLSLVRITGKKAVLYALLDEPWRPYASEAFLARLAECGAGSLRKPAKQIAASALIRNVLEVVCHPGLPPGIVRHPETHSPALNTARPFARQPSPAKPENFGLVYQLLDYLLPKDRRARRDFLRWNGFVLGRPGTKVPWAPLNGSELPGTGKTTWFEMLEAIIGSESCAILRQQDILGTHNGWLIGKTLFYVSEVMMGDRFEFMNALKGYISEKKQPLRMMHTDVLDFHTYANFMLSTNERRPLAFNDKDRRILALRCEATELLPGRFWYELRDMWWRGGGAEYALYLAQRWAARTSANPMERPLKTRWHREIAEGSRPPWERHLDLLPMDKCLLIPDIQEWLKEQNVARRPNNLVLQNELRQRGWEVAHPELDEVRVNAKVSTKDTPEGWKPPSYRGVALAPPGCALRLGEWHCPQELFNFVSERYSNYLA